MRWRRAFPNPPRSTTPRACSLAATASPATTNCATPLHELAARPQGPRLLAVGPLGGRRGASRRCTIRAARAARRCCWWVSSTATNRPAPRPCWRWRGCWPTPAWARAAGPHRRRRAAARQSRRRGAGPALGPARRGHQPRPPAAALARGARDRAAGARLPAAGGGGRCTNTRCAAATATRFNALPRHDLLLQYATAANLPAELSAAAARRGSASRCCGRWRVKGSAPTGSTPRSTRRASGGWRWAARSPIPCATCRGWVTPSAFCSSRAAWVSAARTCSAACTPTWWRCAACCKARPSRPAALQALQAAARRAGGRPRLPRRHGGAGRADADAARHAHARPGDRRRQVGAGAVGQRARAASPLIQRAAALRLLAGRRGRRGGALAAGAGRDGAAPGSGHRAAGRDLARDVARQRRAARRARRRRRRPGPAAGPGGHRRGAAAGAGRQLVGAAGPAAGASGGRRRWSPTRPAAGSRSACCRRWRARRG